MAKNTVESLASRLMSARARSFFPKVTNSLSALPPAAVSVGWSERAGSEITGIRKTRPSEVISPMSERAVVVMPLRIVSCEARLLAKLRVSVLFVRAMRPVAESRT